MANFNSVNLAEIYGNIDAARANQAQQQAQALRQQQFEYDMGRQRQADQRDEMVRNVYSGAIENVDGTPRLNEKRLLSDLYRVDPARALETQDKFTQRDATAAKNKSETAKAELENRKATAAYLRDRLAGVQDQDTYDAVMQEASELGAGFIKGAPREFNPEFVRNQLFTADEFLKQSTPKYEKVDLGGKIQVIDVNPMTNPKIKGSVFDKTLTPEAVLTDQRTRSEGALNRGVTMRGQNMTDARAKETNAKKVAPSEKLTEGMRSTGQYAARMQAAEYLLANTKEQAPGIGEKIAGALGETSANLARSPDRQKALQAQRDWVRAKLRKESGAAIGVDEMNNEILTYFPQIGDSQAVIEQKKQAREQATQGMIDSSGGAYNAPVKPQKPIMPTGEKMPRDVRSEADKILGL